ncbi:MAG: NAD(P)-dependent oxidoreductase [Nitrososphaerota archaeon]
MPALHECLIAIDYSLSSKLEKFVKEQIKRLSEHATIHFEKELSDNELEEIIGRIDTMLVARWPKRLNGELMKRAKMLKLVQSLFAGVDAMPFSIIPKEAIICSNAGAYSDEVAEFSISLLLSAAKSIPLYNARLRQNASMPDPYRQIRTLQGSSLGILGYGGIGRRTAEIARCMGMRILVYSRRKDASNEMNFTGLDGLRKMLPLCDSVIIALPLTKHTRGLIEEQMLNLLKEDAILVNIARGDIVDYKSLALHMERHPDFKYATDVGWIIDGRENYDPEGKLFALENYIVTPHVSGYRSQFTGRPLSLAVDNVIRFYTNSELSNRVDRSEYI